MLVCMSHTSHVCVCAVLAVWTYCGVVRMTEGRCICGVNSCARMCVASCQTDCASCCRCCIYFDTRMGKRAADVISTSSGDGAAQQSRYHGLLRDAESYYLRTLQRRRRRLRGKLQMSLRALNAKMAALRTIENGRNRPTLPTFSAVTGVE